jgi:hypothetical protein
VRSGGCAAKLRLWPQMRRAIPDLDPNQLRSGPLSSRGNGAPLAECDMVGWQFFLLGMGIVSVPSLVLLAFLVRFAPVLDQSMTPTDDGMEPCRPREPGRECAEPNYGRGPTVRRKLCR